MRAKPFGRSSPATAVVAAAPPFANNIFADVEAGEELIPLRELSEQPWVPRKRGVRFHPMKWYRLATRGDLETVRTPSMCTTKSAVLRMFAKLTAGSAA